MILQLLKLDSKLKTRQLRRPVSTHTLRGLLYGGCAGIVLKMIDSACTYFHANTSLGILFAIIGVGALFGTKWPVLWVAVPFIYRVLPLRSGTATAVVLAVLCSALLGALFGGPAGMAIGTIIGRIREKKMQKAPDTVAEGSRSILAGLWAPLAFLALATPLYVLWVIPKMIEVVSR